jgi:hypothetical protein
VCALALLPVRGDASEVIHAGGIRLEIEIISAQGRSYSQEFSYDRTYNEPMPPLTVDAWAEVSPYNPCLSSSPFFGARRRTMTIPELMTWTGGAFEMVAGVAAVICVIIEIQHRRKK